MSVARRPAQAVVGRGAVAEPRKAWARLRPSRCKTHTHFGDVAPATPHGVGALWSNGLNFVAAAMTLDSRPLIVPGHAHTQAHADGLNNGLFDGLSDRATRSRQRRRSALLAGMAAALGLGAMLGHGLAQSLASMLPAAWQGGSGALLGAAVAAVLAPLSGWVALRAGSPSGRGGPALSLANALRPGGRGNSADGADDPAGHPAGKRRSAADAQAPVRDALTGAYTQLHFVAAADREWSRIRRHGEDAT